MKQIMRLTFFLVLISFGNDLFGQYTESQKNPEYYFRNGRETVWELSQEMLMSMVNNQKTTQQKAKFSEEILKGLQYVRVKEHSKSIHQGFLLAVCSTGVFIYNKPNSRITYLDYTNIDFIRRGRSWAYKVNLISASMAATFGVIGFLADNAETGAMGIYVGYFLGTVFGGPIILISHLASGTRDWEKFYFDGNPKRYADYKEIIIEDQKLYTDRVIWKNIKALAIEGDYNTGNSENENESVKNQEYPDTVNAAPTNVQTSETTEQQIPLKPEKIQQVEKATKGAFQGTGGNVNLQWILTGYNSNAVDAEKLMKKFSTIRSMQLDANQIRSGVSNASEAQFLAMIIATGSGVSFRNIEQINALQKSKLNLFESSYPTDATPNGVIDGQSLAEMDLANLKILFDFISNNN